MKEEILKKLLEYMENTKDFVLENAPCFFQEIATYGFIKNSTLSIVGLFLLIFCVYAFWKNFKSIEFEEVRNSYNQLKVDSYKNVAMIVLSSIGIIVGVLGFIICFEPAIKAFFAPKVYILDYLRNS